MRPVVVLGCKPGPGLERRLRQALPYALDLRPVVVTGRGEAPIMREWLVRHGVDPARIIEENEATSTNENLEYTNRILSPPWLVVTSDFHRRRVRMWARHHGFELEVRTARTPWRHLPIREVAALIHSATRIIVRKMLG